MSALAISQKVLSEAGFQVYPVVIAQDGTLPSVVIKLTSEDQHHNVDKAMRQFRATVRMECLASTPAGMNDLAESLKSALETKVAISVTVGGNECSVCFFKQPLDVTDYSDDRTVFRRIMDFDVLWIEV